MKFLGAPGIHGSLSRYLVHNADLCFKLPENVTFDEAAVLEPLAVAVHACQRAEIQVGESVLVQGAGSIGTLCMMTAKALGVGQIVITDVEQRKLDVAKTLGADHIVCSKNKSVEDVKLYPTALNLLASKKVDISRFTSAHYKPEEVVEALERTQKGDVMKVFVQC